MRPLVILSWPTTVDGGFSYKMNQIKWEETLGELRHPNGATLPHPTIIKNWTDDMKRWPEITYGDIFNHFVLVLGVDGSAMKSYKSTEAYQYLHSGKVGRGRFLFF